MEVNRERVAWSTVVSSGSAVGRAPMSNPTRWLAQQYYIILYIILVYDIYIYIDIYIYTHYIQGLSTPLKDYQTPISPIRVWSPLFFGWGYLVRNILRAPPNQSIGTSTRPKLKAKICHPFFAHSFWGWKEAILSCCFLYSTPPKNQRIKQTQNRFSFRLNRRRLRTFSSLK